MHDEIAADRRRFMSIAAAAIAGARLGVATTGTAQTLNTKSFSELKQVDAGVLNVGYVCVPRFGHGRPR